MGKCGGIQIMTEKELQAQINFLVSELERLRNGYEKLSDEAFNDRINKNKFYGMWRKADDKAERYGGLLSTIYDTIHAKVEDDVDYYDVIHQLIDDWYEQEIIK